MKTDLVTNSRIASILDGFGPTTAEHIRAQAHESADLALANGWDPAGDPYEIGAMPGDMQALSERCGRKVTADGKGRGAARALELCIRELMAFAAERQRRLETGEIHTDGPECDSAIDAECAR